MTELDWVGAAELKRLGVTERDGWMLMLVARPNDQYELKDQCSPKA